MVQITKVIKIFKTATTKSILDVRSALNYYQAKNNEQVYKDNIIFTINEYGHSGVQLQAFLPKSTTKMVLDLIKTHHFHHMFQMDLNNMEEPRRRSVLEFSLFILMWEAKIYFFKLRKVKVSLLKMVLLK